MLDSSGNFTAAQTPGTNVHMAGGTIDDSLHTLDVGLPRTIGTSVGVGNLNPKGDALVAELTLSHPLHLLAVYTLCELVQATAIILARLTAKCKYNF